MKDTGSMHKKVQEMVDCYATTDPLKEMSALKKDPDAQVAAVKWLALAALHGVNNNAEKISIRRSGEGKVTIYGRVREPLNRVRLEVGNIWKKNVMAVKPSEMIKIELSDKELRNIGEDTGELLVDCKSRE